MLTHILIQDLAIVSRLELDFSRGLSALTGETGAGKSILVDALGLALGDKTDADTIRVGRERAEVVASFDLIQCPGARAWLAAQALDAILLVPICPHDLSNRPLVVPGSSCIEVRVCGHDVGQARMTCDGQTEVPLPSEALVRICRHPDRACLIHPKGHDHYQILRAKLGWGTHTQVTSPC